MTSIGVLALSSRKWDFSDGDPQYIEIGLTLSVNNITFCQLRESYRCLHPHCAALREDYCMHTLISKYAPKAYSRSAIKIFEIISGIKTILPD